MRKNDGVILEPQTKEESGNKKKYEKKKSKRRFFPLAFSVVREENKA
jgi:hypothetical protein